MYAVLAIFLICLIAALSTFLIFHVQCQLLSFCHCSTVPMQGLGEALNMDADGMERVAYVVRPRNRLTWVSSPIHLEQKEED